MLVNHYNLQNIICVISMAVAIVTLSGRASAQSNLLNHPVFDKYPSPEELQGRINTFKREHANEYEAAKQDFDLAIRFLHNQPPSSDRDFIEINRPIPHKIHKWRLHMPSSRERLLKHQLEREKTTRVTTRMQFVSDNIDKLTVDFSPALRMVILDVILNGWDEWSAWTTDRLKGYRERYPDIYRIIAVNLRGQMNHELWQRHRNGEQISDVEIGEGLQADGVFLQMLLKVNMSAKLQKHVRSQIKNIHANPDALNFVVKLAHEGGNVTVRDNGRNCMASLTESLPVDQQRDFWVQHLDTDKSSIRSYAVSRVGITINLLKKDPKEQAINTQLAERLRKISSSDPDPRIRLEAERRITVYENDSHRRGLIDYGKQKKDE